MDLGRNGIPSVDTFNLMSLFPKVTNKGGSSTGVPARIPLFEFFGGFVFVKFDCITRNMPYTLIAAIIQCLQYVLCSLLSLQNIGYV